MPGLPTQMSDQVFVKDCFTGEVRLASSNFLGVRANFPAWHGRISGDGRYVVFMSTASNLVSESLPQVPQVFRKDLWTCEVALVSSSALGVPGTLESSFPEVSGDGRYVAFWSRAQNLLPFDYNSNADLMRKDMLTGTVHKVNMADSRESAAGPNYSDWGPIGISRNGRYVVFVSSIPDLVPRDTNLLPDVFRKDMESGDILLASCTATGAQGEGMPAHPSVNDDGSVVAFASTQRLTSQYPSFVQVYVKYLETGRVTSVSGHAEGRLDRTSLSGDGSVVAFSATWTTDHEGYPNSSCEVFTRTLPSGALRQITRTYDWIGGTESKGVHLTRAGNGIVFWSPYDEVHGDANGKADVFRAVATDRRPPPARTVTAAYERSRGGANAVLTVTPRATASDPDHVYPVIHAGAIRTPPFIPVPTNGKPVTARLTFAGTPPPLSKHLIIVSDWQRSWLLRLFVPMR